MLVRVQAARKQLQLVLKRVLKERISTNPRTLEKYKVDVITEFNNFTKLLSQLFISASNEAKLVLNENFIYAQEKLQEAFVKLELVGNRPRRIGELIDERLVIFCTASVHDSSIKLLNESQLFDPNIEIEDLSTDFAFLFYLHPTMQAHEYLKLCASTINYTYSGEPTGLTAFINAIDLLNGIATTDPLRAILSSFIKTKVVGQAGDFLNDATNTVDLIKNKLREKIKTDSAKVLEGRLTALKLDRQPLQEFSKTAEDLADQFRRALVMEGIPHDKAEEMTIEKTVKMCRASARTDVVRAILASSKFESPKEVISKLIVEIGTQAEERQVLAYRSNQKTNRPRTNNNFNNSGNFNNNQRGRQFGNNGRNNFNNNSGNNRGNHNNNFNNRPNNYGNNRNQNRNSGNNNQQNNQQNNRGSRNNSQSGGNNNFHRNIHVIQQDGPNQQYSHSGQGNFLGPQPHQRSNYQLGDLH